jgi:hypothetical protein
MSHMNADDDRASRLGGIEGPIEIRDPMGEVLGHLTPAESRRQAMLHEKYKHLFDLKEAERTLATQRDQGRPLEEVIRDLRSLYGPKSSGATDQLTGNTRDQ